MIRNFKLRNHIEKKNADKTFKTERLDLQKLKQARFLKCVFKISFNGKKYSFLLFHGNPFDTNKNHEKQLKGLWVKIKLIQNRVKLNTVA